MFFSFTSVLMQIGGILVVIHEALIDDQIRPGVVAIAAMMIVVGNTAGRLAPVKKTPSELIPSQDMREIYPPAKDY